MKSVELLKKNFFEWRVGIAIACVAQNDLWQYMILKSNGSDSF